MTLEIITSDALGGLRHGFFTRKGGVSSGIFEGLNCGIGSSDQTEAVRLNRARVADAMEVAEDTLHTLHQIHSADVITDVDVMKTRPKADAMVTDQPGVALAVLTADCQPVLFADAQAGVIGAAHAGWKGAQIGVLEATVTAMEKLGANASRIHAVIGPTISQAAYEVGPEFFDSFTADAPENDRFFIDGKGDRLLFDLPAYGLHRLSAAGVGHAEWTHHCTYGDASRFFSYRRTTHAGEADYGRLIAAIRL
ncbi:MAG: peptidoglycan editing factor PgeF [Pseudomonadota bacterium]